MASPAAAWAKSGIAQTSYGPDHHRTATAAPIGGGQDRSNLVPTLPTPG